MSNRDSSLNRAPILSFLSLLLQYPSDDVRDLLLKAAADNSIEKSLKLIVKDDNLIDSVMEEIREMTKKDRIMNLRREYTRLFISSFPKLPCPPYESVYMSPERMVMSNEIEEVLDIMRRWALKLSDNFKDLPEHIAVELELASFLFKKLVELSNSDEETLEIAKRDYIILIDHLRKWVPKFKECVMKESEEDFYKIAADIVSRVIESEFSIIHSPRISPN